MITDPTILSAALEGLEAKLSRLNTMIADIRGRASARAPRTAKAVHPEPKTPAKKTAKKRRLSPEARNRIAEAQKKRWAAARKAKED